MTKNQSLALALVAALAIPVMAKTPRLEKARGVNAPQKVNFVVTLPLEMEPTEDDVKLFTILDSNNDGKKWKYMSSFKGLVSPTNDNMVSDDWAITPGLQITDASKGYEFAFDMSMNMFGPSWTASFEIYLGDTPTAEGMTTLIGKIDNYYAERNKVDSKVFPFAVPSAGTWYLGIRCVSPKEDKAAGTMPWPTTFKNISVKAGEGEATAPKQPTDVAVTPGAKGALSANVAFEMPTVSMNGSTLPASTELTAVITSSVESKTIKGLPGVNISEDIRTVQGDNVITLQINGAVDGEPMSFPVYTGVVLPMRIHDLTYTLSEDNMSMTATWTPPTEGVDGGYVDFDDITYNVYFRKGNDEYTLLKNIGNALTYTYTMEPGAQLCSLALRILPMNAAGESTDNINWVWEDPIYVQDMVGTPYSIPAIEKFDNQELKYSPVSNQKPEGYSGRWYIGDPSECVPDENQSAMICYNPLSEDATKGRAVLPKFSTKGLNNVAFTLTVMRYSSYASNMRIYARNHKEEPTLLGTIYCGGQMDWITQSYPLPSQFQNEEWVQIYIDTDLDDVDYIYAVDSYKFSVEAEHDATVLSVSAITDVETGAEAKCEAVVANLGFDAISQKVKFSVSDRDGKEVASETVDAGTINSGDEKTVKWSFTPSAEVHDSEITLRAALVNPDDVASNDTKEVKIHVRKPALPVVADLKATSTGAGVELNWSEPSLCKRIDESFETLADFYYGENMNEFKAYDGDGKSVYRFTSVSMPNENLPKAFMVVNYNKLSNAEGLEAHSGDKYLMATCPEMLSDGVTPDAANDWLISPQVEERSYVSFYLDLISESYPETVRIMVSNTDAEPASFREIDKVIKTKYGWQKVEFRMPEGAKYFAINYVSRDMFGIMIDDMRYVSAETLHNITQYNVYRDNELLSSVTAPGYVDATVEEGKTYHYHVTTLTDSESIAGNKAEILHSTSGISNVNNANYVKAVSGGIELNGVGEYNVYTLTGIEIANGVADGKAYIGADAGSYIVKFADKVSKIIIK